MRTLALLLLLAGGSACAATIVVDTLADGIAADGACSLREALRNAHLDAAVDEDCAAGDGADRIVFDDALFDQAGLARLPLDPAYGRLAAGNGALEIAAPPSKRLLLDGNGGPILETGPGPFTARRLGFEGGRASLGGAIVLGSGAVLLEDVHFIDNRASIWPGGGAIYRNAGAGGGSLQLRDCLFADNHAPEGSGGAILLYVGGGYEASIEDCRFEANSSVYSGGAVVLQAFGTEPDAVHALHIRDSRFSGNQAHEGGALALWLSEAGPGLLLKVERSVFDSNEAMANGGAIKAAAPGDAATATLRIERSSFVGNQVHWDSGGALHAGSLHVLLQNNQWLDNLAPASGVGAALFADQRNASLPRRLALVGNTFEGNRSGPGDQPARTLLAMAAPHASSELQLAGNAIAGTKASSGDGGECLIDTALPLSPDGGGNVATDASCVPLADDLLVADLALGRLAGNDGHALAVPMPGSPLVDAWPAASCLSLDGVPLDHDLGGALRPGDGDGDGSADCDAGAFELSSDLLFRDGFE